MLAKPIQEIGHLKEAGYLAGVVPEYETAYWEQMISARSEGIGPIPKWSLEMIGHGENIITHPLTPKCPLRKRPMLVEVKVLCRIPCCSPFPTAHCRLLSFGAANLPQRVFEGASWWHGTWAEYADNSNA